MGHLQDGQLCLFGDSKAVEPKSIFKDEEFLTAKEKVKIFKNFKLVLKNKDINKMSKSLYSHLSCHVGFIAHYSIQGFKDYYSGFSGFGEFINELLSYKESCMWGNSTGKDISKVIMKLAKKNLVDITAYIQQQEHQKEILLLKNSSKKL